jgi:hypothetical protein
VFFPVSNDYNNWKNDVSKYTHEKKEFQGKADPYVKVTNAAYKAFETQYNPVTQTYQDKKFEQESRKAEHDNFIHTLAKNKDNALRYEQTYNVINFENKLAGLESRPDYPKEKPWYFRPDRDSLVDYNIVTTHSLQDHYFDAPDKRPKCEDYKVSLISSISNFDVIHRRNAKKT